MNFLTPVAFVGGLIAIPIILLYMLRLRRREVTISSTFLWKQVLQDNEANSPWQRLRRNLLLFLQLLILLFLILALARPFRTVPAVSAGQVTVLLDASASMNATDGEDGETRFSVAKREALDIIETLSVGDKMTIIRVADVPEALISSSSNKAELRDAVDDAKPAVVTGDWEAALNLAAAGGAGAEDFTIVIISDGGLPESAGLQGISGELRYVPVGTASDNVAITALAVRALPGDAPEMFAQITNYGATEARVVFTLLVDNERFATTNEVVAPGDNLPIISSQLPDNFNTLEARLTQSVNSLAPDYLPVDNVAYAVSESGGDRRVLVITEGNIFLEQVLRSLPGIDPVRTNGESGIPDGYDLYIFDQTTPDALPDGDVMFINPDASVPGLFTLGAENENTNNPSAAGGDPRMTFVDVGQLNVLKFRQIFGADWADALITVDGGALLLAGEVGGRQAAIMPFDLRESDLPLQITFPILMSNLTEWFTPRTAITTVNSLSVGESLEIRPPFEADAIRVTLPDGETQERTLERETAIFAATEQQGVYQLEVLNGDAVIGRQLFSVNLFSPLESAIAPIAQTDLTIEGATISTEESAELGQQEFWGLIAVAALLILLIEWVVYHRRMRTPTIFGPIRRNRRPLVSQPYSGGMPAPMSHTPLE
jgi:hypothetical protein